MNIKKIITVRLLICIALLLCLLMYSGYLKHLVNNKIENNVEYRKIGTTDRNKGLTFSELLKLKKMNKDFDITGYSQKNANVTDRYGVEPVDKTRLVYTDENLFKIFKQHMVKGIPIDYFAVKNKNRVVVISDNLATQLYKGVNAIDNTLKINGIKYHVVGIYKKDESMLFNMADDYYEKIFVPYTLSNNMDSDILDELAVKETDAINYNIINSNLNKYVASDLALYSPQDYSVSKKLVYQYMHIMIFIIGFVIIFFALRIVLSTIKQLKNFIFEQLKMYYWKEVIKKNYMKLGLIIIKIIVFLVVVYVVWVFIKFKVVIVDKYMPPDNIFDFNYYKAAIIQELQTVNADELAVSNTYSRFIAIINSTSKFTLLIEIIAFMETMTDLKLWKLVHNNKTSLKKEG